MGQSHPQGCPYRIPIDRAIRIEMALTLLSAEPPLALDPQGVYRVGGTRVTLDTILIAYDLGSTPEGIVEQYPSLRLADVYSVLGYALDHWEDVKEYLDRREIESAKVRRENETKFPPEGLRAKLLKRRQG
jgi:uncharacterized protein (DUF433 family)